MQPVKRGDDFLNLSNLLSTLFARCLMSLVPAQFDFLVEGLTLVHRRVCQTKFSALHPAVYTSRTGSQQRLQIVNASTHWFYVVSQCSCTFCLPFFLEALLPVVAKAIQVIFLRSSMWYFLDPCRKFLFWGGMRIGGGELAHFNGYSLAACAIGCWILTEETSLPGILLFIHARTLDLFFRDF